MYDRNVDGKTLSFEASGGLKDAALIMRDRETDSWWSIMTSEAIGGSLDGEALEKLPVSEKLSYGEWRQRHPDTLVLSVRTGYSRNYLGTAYRGYDESSSVIFPVSHRDRRYHPKEQVIGIELDGEFKAYPFVELARTSGVIHDTVNGRTIKVVFDAENASAVAFDDAGKELPSVTGFWFAWVAFHPDTEVFQAG